VLPERAPRRDQQPGAGAEQAAGRAQGQCK